MAGSCAVCMFPAIELTAGVRRGMHRPHLRHYDAPSRLSPFASATEMPGPQRKPCLPAVAERAELGEGASRLGLMSWLAGWLFSVCPGCAVPWAGRTSPAQDGLPAGWGAPPVQGACRTSERCAVWLAARREWWGPTVTQQGKVQAGPGEDLLQCTSSATKGDNQQKGAAARQARETTSRHLPGSPTDCPTRRPAPARRVHGGQTLCAGREAQKQACRRRLTALCELASSCTLARIKGTKTSAISQGAAPSLSLPLELSISAYASPRLAMASVPAGARTSVGHRSTELSPPV